MRVQKTTLLKNESTKVSVDWSVPHAAQEPHETKFRILTINFNTVAFTSPHRWKMRLEFSGEKLFAACGSC